MATCFGRIAAIFWPTCVWREYIYIYIYIYIYVYIYTLIMSHNGMTSVKLIAILLFNSSSALQLPHNFLLGSWTRITNIPLSRSLILKMSGILIERSSFDTLMALLLWGRWCRVKGWDYWRTVTQEKCAGKWSWPVLRQCFEIFRDLLRCCAKTPRKLTYRGADKSLARPTSRCILFDG